MDMNGEIDRVLTFWFETLEPKDWFMKSDKVDADIKAGFRGVYDDAIKGGCDSWQASPDGILALIILLDQFPRNMFRDTAGMYQSDEQAMSVARHAIETGLDRQVADDRRIFVYLPFEHSESLDDQNLCYDLVATLSDESYLPYAEAHRRIIKRFGRFPHRNALLGRESTPEEIEFLKEEGSSF